MRFTITIFLAEAAFIPKKTYRKSSKLNWFCHEKSFCELGCKHEQETVCLFFLKVTKTTTTNGIK